jgi:hypothetical protein
VMMAGCTIIILYNNCSCDDAVVIDVVVTFHLSNSERIRVGFIHCRRKLASHKISLVLPCDDSSVTKFSDGAAFVAN